MYRDRNLIERSDAMDIKANNELIVRGLASYFGMSVTEFAKLINDDVDKFKRFYYDFVTNHN